jgi:hypothetical protein
MVWVQQVDILYTKASRGAPAAAARNQLSRAFPIQLSGGDQYGFDYYKLLEWSDFVPTLEKTENASSPPNRQGDLVIDADRGAVKLELRWNQAIGQPPRRAKLSALTLLKGQVARLIINGRYTSYSGQIYTEATYNVAFADSLKPDVFLDSSEAAVLDMRADLF